VLDDGGAGALDAVVAGALAAADDGTAAAAVPRLCARLEAVECLE
jgi:hypothetical protein